MGELVCVENVTWRSLLGRVEISTRLRLLLPVERLMVKVCINRTPVDF